MLSKEKAISAPLWGVVHPVDGVANVVHIPGNGGQLAVPLGIAQSRQDFPGGVAAFFGVGKAVLGVANGPQTVVAPLDVAAHLLIAEDVLRHHVVVSHGLYSAVSMRYMASRQIWACSLNRRKSKNSLAWWARPSSWSGKPAPKATPLPNICRA